MTRGRALVAQRPEKFRSLLTLRLVEGAARDSSEPAKPGDNLSHRLPFTRLVYIPNAVKRRRHYRSFVNSDKKGLNDLMAELNLPFT